LTRKSRRGISGGMAFSDDVERAAAPAPKVWLLIVWKVNARQSGLMSRLKLQKSRKNPSTFWRTYPQGNREQVIVAIKILREAGMHGTAKLSEAPTPARLIGLKTAHLPKCNREGFGAALNARPIAGSWSRKTRHK
jgi:hypothetical protein